MPNGEIWIYLNAEELKRIFSNQDSNGLDEFDTKLYVLIRKYMEGSTGIVGQKRKISYQGLAEEMYVKPERGSHKDKKKHQPTRKKLRFSIERLEKSGLLTSIGDKWHMIFKCNFAPQDKSVQMRRGQDEGPGGGARKEKINNPLEVTDSKEETPEQEHIFDPEEGPGGGARRRGTPLYKAFKALDFLKAFNAFKDLKDLEALKDLKAIKAYKKSCVFFEDPIDFVLEGENAVLPLDAHPGVSQDQRFDEFWKAYPRKENKKRALEIWRSKKLDCLAEKIIADVEQRKQSHQPWLGGYIPHATTYLNGERWQDQIISSSTELSPPVKNTLSVREHNEKSLHAALNYQDDTA